MTSHVSNEEIERLAEQVTEHLNGTRIAVEMSGGDAGLADDHAKATVPSIKLLSILSELQRLRAREARLRDVLESDWAESLWKFLISEYGADPDTGEVVTVDVRPHFKALCDFMGKRAYFLSSLEKSDA